jgi:hypothetical protein
MFFEHQQKRCYEPTLTIQKSYAPPSTQKNFPIVMPTQPLAISPKDNPMQTDKTKSKPLMEQVKQH